jgi:hypothetical protein
VPDRLGWLAERRIVAIYQRLGNHGNDLTLDSGSRQRILKRLL